jgi:hypothetical protein
VSRIDRVAIAVSELEYPRVYVGQLKEAAQVRMGEVNGIHKVIDVPAKRKSVPVAR